MFVSWFKHWEYTEIRMYAVLNTQVGDPVVLISFFSLIQMRFDYIARQIWTDGPHRIVV